MKANRFLGAALAALLSTSALAQVNFVPQSGITSGYYAKQTYSSAFFGLVAVTGATDVVCIAGSASKVVRVVDIKLSGTVATAAITFPVQVVRRALVDTAGTAATTTANPGVATQIASRDTGQGLNTSSTATLISYTANPTINDSAPVYLDSQLVSLNLTSVGASQVTDFNFGLYNEDNIQPATLRGTAQQICVNFGATAFANATAINGVISWTEE
jgi:hypothetical protein